jgi:tRNA (cmo5U34)-methyltransferase
MSTDQVFKKNRKIEDFKFGDEVVSVFDDMVNRSVPYYQEIQRMIGEMGGDFATPGSNLYDLGCSTGNSMLILDKTVDPDVTFMGIDDSPEMLQKCEAKLKKHGIKREYEMRLGDLNTRIDIDNASLVNLCLTLQFVRPLHRESLVKNIFDNLREKGALILVEKVLGEYNLVNRLFTNYYYDMKRRHNYSETEISQKREALENILIPYKLKDNKFMLEKCGFNYIDVFFKWYNFCGIVAVK